MLWRDAGLALLVGCIGTPMLAEGHGPAAVAIFAAETCLQGGDQAFEHSLQEDLAPQDQDALVGLVETASFECLGLAMEICEGQDAALACLGDLETWASEARGAIVARLPDAAEAEGYADVLERAGADADDAACNHMNEDQRTRYCGMVAEGLALEDAYAAWRMARRTGAVPLEGHDPVDLELIR
ncbi:hypothetical protein [Jannaschia sp. CCS1]|uniref:hypothetical protein n=1 Tax=Jannaschia sp. (strain CCS1) TaxID=290400 RepID=UPI000302387F|nr:hypothetical protein [Jannaschia sp. CCS1]